MNAPERQLTQPEVPHPLTAAELSEACIEMGDELLAGEKVCGHTLLDVLDNNLDPERLVTIALQLLKASDYIDLVEARADFNSYMTELARAYFTPEMREVEDRAFSRREA